MRITGLFLLVLFSSQVSFGKSVDESKARIIAANFCKSEGLNSGAFTLVYQPTSVVNNTTVTDFYVFNNSTGGFVMVAGDDNVMPVLGYSTESAFRADNMPDNVAWWMTWYAKQIEYAIGHNVASQNVSGKWSYLLSAGSRAAKTTTTYGVTALCKTFWNQSPYYNALCPYDASADTNVVTGCVATAMAQVMKYWNWPRKGVGSHSYNSSYGLLSANFGATVFQWDSMKNAISKVDTAVALLMYEAGVSVNMSYGLTESGAFVNANTSPITNCAEYALKEYFSYDPTTIQGIFRSGYSDSDWVHLLKAEADAGRPALYTGYGSQGGHCWVADGYTNGNRIHFNWGWGGYCNGYFVVENLVPGGTDLNGGHTVMTGIKPDSSLVAGISTVAGEHSGVALYPNPANDVLHINFGGEKVSEVRVFDMAGREVKRSVVTTGAASATISVAGLSAGAYVAQMLTATGMISRTVSIAPRNR